MATTTRGGSSGGREKRGTSPGPLTKKSPKPSSPNPGSSSNSPTQEKTSSPTDGKPVPNYLKPTISSNLDFSRLPKKPSTDSSAQKPLLNRRRSFDRPPPASQVQKAIRNVPAVREIKPLRSSSFKSGSTSSAPSTRPASERIYARTTSSIKDKDSKVEPALSKSRSLKKTISSSSKKDANGATPSSSTKRAPKSVASESSIDDNASADQLGVEDDLVNIDSEVQSLPEISEMPDSNEELGDPTTITDVKEKPVEDVQDSPVVDEKKDVHEEKSEDVDQVAEEAVIEESVTNDHEHEQKDNQADEAKPEPETAEEAVTDEPEVTVSDDQPEVNSEPQNLTVEVAGETREADKEAPVVEQTEALAEENKEEEKKEESVLEQEVEKGGEEAETKVETVTVTSPSAPSVPSASDAAPARTQSTPGKKDKQDYNNVIEETAGKLRGKRNKVLALAGAFETVISLDSKKN